MPIHTNYGVLEPGMGQALGTDQGSSKLYVPLDGEAELHTPAGVWPLRRGLCTLIPEGTPHEVPQVGYETFINLCISWQHAPGEAAAGVVQVPFDLGRLVPGHHGTILCHGLLPPEARAPFGSAYGLLHPDMAQESTIDEGLSKIYVPLEGEAELITPVRSFQLRRGAVYLIRSGTEHEVQCVGEEDFVNVCCYWRDDG
ncbi:MAG: hypothetical protein HYU66_14115 [Armatimonadetes bacterium]|nr:hypothetical protein [Armatimonadota bacterium]